MKIYVYESSILRTKSTEVEVVDDELRLILNKMMKVMEEANGIGLAANQVGIDKRFFVLDVEGRKIKVINPKIIKIPKNGDTNKFAIINVNEIVL